MARRKKLTQNNRVQNSLPVQLFLLIPFLFVEIGDVVRLFFRLLFSSLVVTYNVVVTAAGELIQGGTHWLKEKTTKKRTRGRPKKTSLFVHRSSLIAQRVRTYILLVSHVRIPSLRLPSLRLPSIRLPKMQLPSIRLPQVSIPTMPKRPKQVAI